MKVEEFDQSRGHGDGGRFSGNMNQDWQREGPKPFASQPFRSGRISRILMNVGSSNLSRAASHPGATSTQGSSVWRLSRRWLQETNNTPEEEGMEASATHLRDRASSTRTMQKPETSAWTGKIRRMFQERMRVIFLDIDGVLHSVKSVTHFTESCMRELRRIIQMTGAKVVLSSNWRMNEGLLERASRKLQDYGIRIFDITPINYRLRSRAEEICAWLETHPKVSQYVVLDDMDISLGARPEMRARFVKTMGSEGLTTRLADDAIAKLRGSTIR
uniref:FCP1 homology domain-containing protein n=1 Tax=Compsopogon caeruleus TaxID=31354 RepID=A0A7S1TH69_9RHOD|mmetsp:Transcript_7182/g.14763  ORF Transcript_7182/g.14763 Transcript_7182/m.14763 type:complete len:274 (+) Transcript_7182:98-919(+)|eukprot:CAMPEP_0184680128 /NCGR_PEP_ID=MMETSP0312-20130426/2989_1 /TAXON_ID=31354 /ORGANISM="Compsopogon coeruleus, Strain SAG 36.94" /LENGTH=273 /DNA_ID=CAMNT_0027130031 /DNA_START=173 /DNA_END=994 /DNA_ORIENTATION=-